MYGPDHTFADSLLSVANRSFWSQTNSTHLLEKFSLYTFSVLLLLPHLLTDSDALPRSVQTQICLGSPSGHLVDSSFLHGSHRHLPEVFHKGSEFFRSTGLTYNNEYTEHGPLDAEERFKAFPDTRVRLGCVQDDGMIAKTVFGDEARVSPLRKELRNY